MKNITFLVMSLSLFFSAPVFAQINAQKLDPEKIRQAAVRVTDNEFKNMDKDKDGKISKQEYLNYVMQDTLKKYEAAFKNLDQDNNGYISKAEYEDFMNFATGKLNEFMKMMQK